MAASNQSTVIQVCLDRIRQGDDSARIALLECATERLARLARKMLKGSPRVHRWEQTDDVLQNALLRLRRRLETSIPDTVRSFFNLAAVEIRRELIDLARHYYGPRGMGAHHESQALASATDESPVAHAAVGETNNPETLGAWTAFHEEIAALGDEDREMFDLLWYQGLTQRDAAEVLRVSEKTVNRRWVAARMRLGMALGDTVPP